MYVSLTLVDKHLSYAKKMIFFLKKRIEAIFVYILEYMLTLVSLYKKQNISTLMRKSSKSEGRAL